MRRPKNDYVPAEYGGYILNDAIPEYTEEDAGKSLKVNQNGVGIGWHEDIYDNTKNILRNGEPTFSMTRDTEISDALDLDWYSWTFARGTTGDNFDWGGDLPYFHFIYSANTPFAQSYMQLQKAYITSGVRRNTGEELKSLIPGAKMTLSFEIKSDIPIKVLTRLECQDTNNTRIFRIFNKQTDFETSAADWTLVTVSDIVPENYKEMFSRTDIKNLYLLVQTIFIDENHRATGDVYIRNIKMEYGDAATPYTYSDIDQRLINYDINSTLAVLTGIPDAEGVSF